MKRRPPIALLTLNAALLGTLAFVTFAPDAEAQQAARSRGRYGIISGWVMKGSSCSLCPSLRKQTISTTTSFLNCMR